MVGDPAPGFTTTELAAAAGISAGALRMWQSRHGFPSPGSMPGAPRRYTRRDVETVREVVRLRAHGLSIGAAIERACAARPPVPASVFAGLRAARPDLHPARLVKRDLLALTRAIEDEYCARAAAGLLVGSFQRAAHYRSVERRWRELARTAELACALADFERLRMPAGAPVEVPVGAGNPIAREWTLVIDAPGARACVAAWELAAPAALPDLERRFEVIWSFEPDAVLAARAIACRLISELAPELTARLPEPGEQAIAGSAPELRFATGLAQRIVAYLAHAGPSARA